MKILSLCDRTGNMVRPWANAGHRCICVDIRHTDHQKGNVEYFGRDVRELDHGEIPFGGDIDICFAFPPCTDLSVSGARWFRKKGLRALSEAIDIFGACVNIVELVGCGFVENPVSVISTHYRKPDYIFDPCDYGDAYRKKTCLWTFGDFIMPVKQPVEPVGKSPIHHMPPGPDRGDLRSITPMGFAQAVFEANVAKQQTELVI